MRMRMHQVSRLLPALVCLIALALPLFAQPEMGALPIEQETDETRLLELLANEKPRVRAQAAERLGEFPYLEEEQEQIEETLLALLTADPDAAVRKAAALSLGQLGVAKAANPLAMALQDADPAVRTWAAFGLGALKDPRAVEPVTALLKDKDKEIRGTAVEVLFGYEDARLTELIVPLLEDPAMEVRAFVIHVLASLRHPKAVELLLAQLKSPEMVVRGNAALMLAQIREARAVPLLLDMLRDKEPQVVAAATKALGYFKDERALKPLLAVARDHNNPNTRLLALEALVEFNTPPAVAGVLGAMRDTEEDVRQFAIMKLAQMGSEHVEQITNAVLALLADRDPDVRTTAAALLAALNNPKVLDQLLVLAKDLRAEVRQGAFGALGKITEARVLPALIAGLHDTDEDVREMAAGALTRCKDSKTPEALIAALADPDPNARAMAARVIREIRLQAAADALAGLLADQDARVRMTATLALARLRDARALEPLLAQTKSRDTSTRIIALNALGMLGNEQAVTPIVAALKDRKDDIRAAAHSGLRELQSSNQALLYPVLPTLLKDASKESLNPLLNLVQNCRDVRAVPMHQILLRDPRAAVRRAAVQALNGYYAETRPLLLEALKDTDGEVRRIAARGLERHGNVEVTDALAALLNDPDPEVRTEVTTALAARYDARALPGLLTLLTGTDPSERAAAATALGTLNDLRAVEPLIHATRDLHTQTRINAAYALRHLASEHRQAPEFTLIVEALCALVEDRNSGVRWAAMQSLGNIAYAPAATLIIAALADDNSDVRREAARALAEIKDPRALEPLLGLTGDPDAGVRRAVITAISQFDDPRSAKAVVAALTDPDGTVQQAALEAMGKQRDKYGNLLAEGLLPLLRNPDYQVRRSAAQQAKPLRDPRLLEPLVVLLHDPLPEVRRDAADALNLLRDPRAVEPLLAALEDGDKEVVQRVRSALGEIKDPGIDAKCLALLAHEKASLRASAALILGYRGNTQALGELVRLLRDPAPEVRADVAAALGAAALPAQNAPDSPVVTALLAVVNDADPGVRKAVLPALARYDKDPRAIEALCAAAVGADAELRGIAVNAMPSEANPRITEALLVTFQGNDPKLRESAVRTLWYHMDAHAVKVLLAELPKEDGREYSPIRNPAIYALGMSKSPEAAAGLLAYLRDRLAEVDPENLAGIAVPRELRIKEDWGKYGQASSALRMLEAAAVEPMIAALRDDRREMRLAVMPLLAQHRDARAVPGLLACAMDPDPLVRRAAVQALGFLGEARAFEPALAALRAPEAKMRATAALALGRIGDARAVEPILQAMRDADADTRFCAARALGLLGDARAVEALLPLLADADDGVRAQAAWALGEMPDARAAQPLLALLTEETPEVRTAAIGSVGKLAEAKVEVEALRVAVEPLLALLPDTPRQPMVEHEPVAVLHLNVITTLGALGDARAVAPLIEIARTRYQPFSISAANALGRFPEPGVIEALITVAVAPDFYSDDQVARILARMGAPAVEPLLAALRAENPKARTLATRAFQAMAEAGFPLDGPTREALLAALADAEITVAGNAARALAATKEPRLADLLLACLPKTPTYREGWMYETLGLLGDLRALEPILAIIDAPKTDGSAYSSAGAGLVKLAMAHPDAEVLRQAVSPLLQSENAWTRRNAAIALSYLDDARALEPLREAVAKWDVYTRDVEAVKALARLTDPRATDPLIALLRHPETEINYAGTNTPLTLREQTAISLGDHGDPRAIPALTDALGYGNPRFRHYVAQALAKLKGVE